MVDINKKEKTLPPETQPAQPEASEAISDSTETVTPESQTPDIAQPEVSTETPEPSIEQVQEQISEVSETPSKAKPAPVSNIMKDEDLIRDLKDVMALEKPKQVKVLVYLAFKKGVHHAAHIAKKLKDPYLMDEFHDTLVSELYSLLLKKKKVKQK